MNFEANINKVTDLGEIAQYGIMPTTAIIVNKYSSIIWKGS